MLFIIMTKSPVYCNSFTITAKVSMLPYTCQIIQLNETVFALNADVNKVLTSVDVVSG